MLHKICSNRLDSFTETYCRNCLAGIALGAKSMDPIEAHSVLTKIDTLTPAQFAHLSRILFYVITYSTREVTKLGGYLIENENDGTVPLTSQFLRTFGRKLALLSNIGHTDLVLSGTKSSLSEKDRWAFAETLFETLTDRKTFYESGMDDLDLQTAKLVN